MKLISSQKTLEIVEKEKIHEGEIYTCYELNDGTVVSAGSDKLIKFKHLLGNLFNTDSSIITL